ncbi:MAG: amidohydrolase, partial [Pseudomonadota bacterium]|nr:amidohydrolase [Pseudomonadota bacterium]
MSRFMKFALLGILFGAVEVHGQTTVITGATVHTVGPDGTIENATVVIDKGRIAAVGTDIIVPEDARTIDGRDKIITPG